MNAVLQIHKMRIVTGEEELPATRNATKGQMRIELFQTGWNLKILFSH